MTKPGSGAAAVIRLCPDGPLLVGGSVEVRDETGRLINAEAATVALCRCGQSANGLLCDGPHTDGQARRRCQGVAALD
jgi:CDGSH-type Zn-finger protein